MATKLSQQLIKPTSIVVDYQADTFSAFGLDARTGAYAKYRDIATSADTNAAGDGGGGELRHEVPTDPSPKDPIVEALGKALDKVMELSNTQKEETDGWCVGPSAWRKKLGYESLVGSE